jgi:hypothetical protein
MQKQATAICGGLRIFSASLVLSFATSAQCGRVTEDAPIKKKNFNGRCTIRNQF